MLLVDFADLDFLRNFKTSDLVCGDEGGISWLKNPYVYSGRFEAVGSFHLDAPRPIARKIEDALSNRSGIVDSLKLSGANYYFIPQTIRLLHFHTPNY